MVLRRGFFAKVQNILSQQVRSVNCKLEDSDQQLSLFPLNSVGSYNDLQQHISNGCLTVDSSLNNDTNSLLPESSCGHDNTVLNLIDDL